MVPPLPRILVVDDEVENLRALERTLRRKFDLTCCAEPTEALKKIDSEEFAVVISDQKMPQMSGTDLLAKIAEKRPLTTRIILTAYTETREMLDAINRAEIYRYIIKPWDNDELLTVLLKAVEHHQLRSQNEQLIRSLEKKNERLEEKEAELLDLNKNLEQLVEERTSELQRANDRLNELAMTDPLTKALNRRAFFSKFREEVDRASRYNRPLTVAMIDVDHFKSFNDMEGHVFGDEALRKVATVFEKNLRKTDVLGRYGGEEFAILMPETPVDIAKTICERLRARVEMTEFQGKSGTAYLTISVGIAGFPEAGKEMKELIEAADQALYSAKRTGRNKVVHQGSDVSFFAS